MVRRMLMLLAALLVIIVAAPVFLVWTPLVEPAARVLLRDLLPGIRFGHIAVDGWLRVTLDDVRAVDEGLDAFWRTQQQLTA